MHITIDNVSQFHDQFRQMGRSEQFSLEALGLLYDLLIEFDGGDELDVVALCCEFAESTFEDVAREYGLEEGQDPINYLNERTLVVGVTASGNVVYQQF